MKTTTLLFFLLITSIHFTCKKDSSDSSATTTTTGTTTTAPTVKCDTSIVKAKTGSGCYPRLVTPVMCETIDLSGGKTYEIAWTTDGTICETPWTLQIAGNPLSNTNIKSWSLSTNVNTGITKYGGIVRISAADLEGLTTDNGLYHWTVASFYDSYPASQTFKVKK
ncbi:MAG: hypothetical protein V4590_09645 [Bacteroidota bacterium]